MCIPRENMPQVDMGDIPGLLEWLASVGVEFKKGPVPTADLRPIQCIHQIAPVRRREMLVKPILASQEPFIIDGNHRWATFVQDKVPSVECIMLNRDFYTAAKIIRDYAKAYSYGDGKVHPESW